MGVSAMQNTQKIVFEFLTVNINLWKSLPCNDEKIIIFRGILFHISVEREPILNQGFQIPNFYQLK